MIRTKVVEVTGATNEETVLGWCLFDQVPIVMPAMIPGAPAEAQPQARPVIVHIGAKPYYVLGYRWDVAALDEVPKADLPLATLYLVVRAIANAPQVQLVRAGAGALEGLPKIGQRGN